MSLHITGPEGGPSSPREDLIRELADLLNDYTDAVGPDEMVVILQCFVNETENYLPKNN